MPDHLAPRRVHPALAIVAASLPVFMATLDNLVVTGALPVLHTDLGASLDQLQWVVNAFTLTFASLMLGAATAGDRWGRRRIFLLGLVVFTLASIAAALAGSPEALIAARAVQGVGAAAITPLSLALVASSVAPERRAAAIGIWGGVTGLGVALGPVIGGAVVDGLSWQWIFWLNVPVAAVALPLILRALPESHGRRVPLDLAGTALGAGAVLGIVWAVVHADAHGWGSGTVLVPLGLGALALLAFLLRQATARFPLLPLRLFRSRGFSAANAVMFLFQLGAMGSVFLLTQELQIAMGYTPLEAGVRTLPWTALPMLVAPVAGVLAGRIGPRPLLVTGLALTTAGLGWIAAHVDADTVYLDLVPGLVLAGLGTALVFAPSATAVLHGLDAADHATASSTNTTLREIGLALGVAVLTLVFQDAGGSLTPAGFVAGTPAAVGVGAGAVALATLLALLVPGRTGGVPSPRRGADAVAVPVAR
ncbi:EmrB/QacA subfamily drug resistance transporter [Kineococcus radiotolerans]|uniref:EmrB/QacA subfamily drug resistance transporter n=1 Tax=Kineococcus radiotolerans TaxID=131568 RepID=A0A7W4TJ52_KINRA|nr:DHA2 family efflux MFS transporter permease subunit [Kineococcus radiotolerans]MBB2899864.1 EmrB/QacA subfamily drug resistance transporter [Kineococcus radiotolerans]